MRDCPPPAPVGASLSRTTALAAVALVAACVWISAAPPSARAEGGAIASQPRRLAQPTAGTFAPLAAGSLARPADESLAPRIDGLAGLMFPPRRRFVPGELIVRFRLGVGAGDRRAARAAVGARVVRRIGMVERQLVRIAATRSVLDSVDALERDPDVLFAEPNYYYQALAIPNDTRFGELWGMNNAGQVVSGSPGTPDADIDAPEAWDVTTGTSGVVVAIVDTGVATTHPDLAPNIVAGYDFVDSDSNPTDFEGHGTHVAGTIGARGNDAAGVAGVAGNTALMPLRALDGNGSGTNAGIAAAFTHAGANGARVVNASLGGPDYSQTILDAVNGAPNTLFVVAAGNDGTSNDSAPTYPCDYPAVNIVCVAATDQNDALASFSNYSSTKVDLAAPGTSISSTQPAYNTLFTDDLEGAMNWTPGGSPNSWAQSTGTGVGGSKGLSDSPAGNYVAGTNNWADLTSPVNLSGQSGCRLEYSVRLSSYSGDGLVVWAKSGSLGSWVDLTGGGLSGSTGGSFVPLGHHLGSVDGSSAAYVSFQFISNGDASVSTGADIDDVQVRCLSGTFGPGDFTFLDGTSMATPHVAGTAALIYAVSPSATPAMVRNALLASVDKLTPLASKVYSGGRLNAARAIDPAMLTAAPTPPQGVPANSPEAPPTLLFSAKPKQSMRKQKGRAIVSVECNKPCRVKLTTTVATVRPKKRFSLKPLETAELAAAARKKVRVTLSAAATRAVKRALKRRKRAVVTVTAVATDLFGRVSDTRKRKIVLIR